MENLFDYLDEYSRAQRKVARYYLLVGIGLSVLTCFSILLDLRVSSVLNLQVGISGGFIILVGILYSLLERSRSSIRQNRLEENAARFITSESLRVGHLIRIHRIILIICWLTGIGLLVAISLTENHLWMSPVILSVTLVPIESFSIKSMKQYLHILTKD